MGAEAINPGRHGQRHLIGQPGNRRRLIRRRRIARIREHHRHRFDREIPYVHLAREQRRRRPFKVDPFDAHRCRIQPQFDTVDSQGADQPSVRGFDPHAIGEPRPGLGQRELQARGGRDQPRE